MIRLVLCGLILSAGLGAGFSLSRMLTNRRIRLEELLTAVSILEAEMNYRMDPIPQLLARVSSMAPGVSAECLKAVCSCLDRQTLDFPECFSLAVDQVYGGGTLKEEDLLVLKEFGVELGKTDLENQHSLFVRTLSRLSAQKEKALAEERTRGRMYRCLGGAAGFLIVILLI